MAKILLCIDGLEESGAQLPAFPAAGLTARGTVRTAPEGAVPDSMGCILRLLGTKECCLPAGRAALEARAVGVPLAANDAVLRCTLCTVSGGVLAPAPARSDAALAQMRAALHADLPRGWTLHTMSGYRCLLRMRGGAAALPALETLPPHQHYGEPAADCLPRGGELGAALAALARTSMQRLSGFILLPWGQSCEQTLPPLAARIGTRSAMVCGAEIVRGIALALGMECPRLPHATADVDTDLAEKCAQARALARDHPFVFVHVNGCDEAAHRRNSAQKAAFLRKILRELLEPLRASLGEGDRLLVCSDHRTSSESGAHQAGMVQFWQYEAGEVKPVKTFNFTDTGAPLGLLLGEGETK